MIEYDYQWLSLCGKQEKPKASSDISTFFHLMIFMLHILTLSLPVLCWAGDNTDLPLDSNISKTVTVNITCTRTFFKEYSLSFLMVCRLIDFALPVLKLLMLKVCGIIGISKIAYFNFSGTERVKKLIGWLYSITFSVNFLG